MRETEVRDGDGTDVPHWSPDKHYRWRAGRAAGELSLLPVPSRLPWAVLTVVLGWTLLVAFWQLGAHATPPAGLSWSPVDWLFRLAAGLAEVVTTSGARLPERLTVLLLASIFLIVGHNWRRAHLAACPGAVDVRELVNGTADGDLPRVELRSRLCRQLSETRLYPPSTGSGSPAPRDFLDVWTTNQQAASGGVLGAIISMMNCLARAWPRVAYEVSATLLKREQEPRYGMIVTVTSLAQGNRSAMETVWGRNWEDTTCHAGYWVMSVILPVTRLVNTPPWRMWRGRRLPTGLFQAYNEGRHSHDCRQFDLALRWYAEALRADPLNLELRLLVADVFEELGCYLEALYVYRGALECDGRRSGGCGEFRTWRWDWFRWQVKKLADRCWCRWERRPDLKLRYRYAVALAISELVVPAWFTELPPGDHRLVREQMKERLRAAFDAQYGELTPPLTAALRKDLRAILATRSAEADEAALHVIFRMTAMWELYDLYRDLPFRRNLRRFGRGRIADQTGRSLWILCQVWAPLRAAQAFSDWSSTGRRGAALIAALRESLFEPGSDARKSWDGWTCREAGNHKAPRAQAVDDALRAAIGHPVEVFLYPLTFADHYHAALAYSMVLAWQAIEPETETEADELAERAIWHLRAALANTEAPTAGRFQDWVLRSDPSLAGLRQHPKFRYFERDLFPRPAWVPPRPTHPYLVCNLAYARRLIIAGADLLERQWHQNATCGGDVHDLKSWLNHDVEIWTVLCRIADDGAEYWKDRASFIFLVRDAVDPVAAASARFPPVHPQFEEVALEGEEELSGSGQEPIEALARLHSDILRGLLRGLIQPLAEQGEELGRVTRSLSEDLDQRGRRPDKVDLRRICTVRAARWQEVSRYLRIIPPRINEQMQPDAPLRP